MVVAAAAAVVVAGVSGVFGSGSPGAETASSAYRTSTATVTRQSLTSQTQVVATLGDAGTYSVVNQAQGTITELPGAGQVVRQGQVLYRVSGSPVVLLYGPVQAYRDLAEGMTGPDVAELNANLVQLRDAYRRAARPRARAGTTSAPRPPMRWTRCRPPGGDRDRDRWPWPGRVLAVAALITGLGDGHSGGGTAIPGSMVLTASSTTPVVTVAWTPRNRPRSQTASRCPSPCPTGSTTPG